MSERLVLFLYLLMNDGMPIGTIKRLISTAEEGFVIPELYLENYAKQLVERLLR